MSEKYIWMVEFPCNRIQLSWSEVTLETKYFVHDSKRPIYPMKVTKLKEVKETKRKIKK